MSFTVIIHPSNVVTYKNEYSERLISHRFVEAIHIDPQTCTYKQWDSTQYVMTGVVMAKGLT